MKRFVLISTLLSQICINGNTHLPQYQNKYLQPDIKQVFVEKHATPLTVDEKQQLKTFKSKVGDMPNGLFFDLMGRGLGIRKGAARDLSQEEKTFLKANLENLHLIPFLVFLNLSDMGLETLPDTIGALPNLGVLKLNGNNLKTVPPAIDALLGDGRMLLLDINENPLETTVSITYSKKALETLYQSNELSVLPWEKLEWKVELTDPEALVEIEENPTDTVTYSPLIELIMLSILEPFEKEQAEWLDRPENLVRLSGLLQGASPKEAAEYIASNPEKIFPEPMYGMHPQTIRTSMCEMVLNHLCDSGRVGIVGNRCKTSNDETFIKPEAVTGWTRYFTAEPLQEVDIWFTAEGVSVLFHMVQMLKSVYHADLTDKDVLAYELFRKKHNVPFMLSEDIKLFRSVGIRGVSVRVLTNVEKEWIKNNIGHLGELPFLKFLDLSNLGLKSLPANFNNFRDLLLLHLKGNKFVHVPEVLAVIHGRHQKVGLLFDDYLMTDKEQRRFRKICDKKREAYVRASVIKANIKPEDLVWHPQLLKNLGLSEFVPFKKLSRLTVKEKKAQEAKMRKLGEEFLKAFRSMENDKEKEIIEQEKRYAYYQHAFFELMLREAERQVDMVDKMANAILSATQANEELAEEEISEEGEIEQDAWFEDHKILLSCLLSSHTPAEFIALFEDEKKFLPKMLKEKKKRENARAGAPELYSTFRDESKGLNIKKLSNRTNVFFTLLATNLQTDCKIVALQGPFDGINPPKIEYLGWQNYFNQKPYPGQKIQGWLKRKGIAELLVYLKLAKVNA